MGRGRRDVSKTRRILVKILAKVLYKQIIFEENTNIRSIAWIKAKYIEQIVVLRLNDLGIRLMSEEQLTLPLERKSTLRVDHRLKTSSRRSHRRKRPRSLI